LLNCLQNHNEIIPDLRKVVSQVYSMGGFVLAAGAEIQNREYILKEIGVDIVKGCFYGKPEKSRIVLNLEN
jgi:hypothetical protein